jgi:hypothetical protein
MNDVQATSPETEPYDKAPVGLLDALERCREFQHHPGLAHLAGQQVDDLLARTIAEQLPERLLVVGDPIAVDQLDEVGRRVPGQRRDREPLVGRNEAVRPRPGIGEIAAPAAGNADLLAGAAGMIEDQHGAATPARLDGGHHAGGAGPCDDDVESAHEMSLFGRTAPLASIDWRPAPAANLSGAPILRLTLSTR